MDLFFTVRLGNPKKDFQNYSREQSSSFAKYACACKTAVLKDSFSSNISNMRCSVSSPDETPRRELKIRRAAEYF